jgi:predicted nuclease with TOPRIM domain
MPASATATQLQLLLERVDELKADVKQLRDAVSELCVQGAKRNGAVSALEHRVGMLESRLGDLPCSEHTQQLAELRNAEKGNRANWNRVANAVVQAILMVAGLILGYIFGGAR